MIPGLLDDDEIKGLTQALCERLVQLPLPERVRALNEVRTALHEVSPFRDQPVDCVLWVAVAEVEANSYNPNRVASPEMKLLETSVLEDGYTQPVVTWLDEERREVVDGYHRSRVAKECPAVRKRLYGYLPVTTVNEGQSDRPNRMASTIRHNRARGEHQIDLMQEIVADLVQSGMSDTWIMKHLGMCPDELLRLKQLTGIAALFRDQEFSRAWVRQPDEAKLYERESNA